MIAPLRFGLVGTGYWAQETHARSITATEGIEFSAVWGRRQAAVDEVARRFGVAGFTDFDAFLDEVDALSFAVPPDVQSTLALRAIRAGKHVLLEKPIAVDAETADELVDAAELSGVSTMVFFTLLFDPRMRAIAAQAESAHYTGGQGLWLGSALSDENPFNTPWRHDKGGLWDLGPHALSVLWATLGPIVATTATSGAGDLVHLTMRHDSGATSTATLTLNASDAADGFSTVVWGVGGRLALPVDDVDELQALGVALSELAANIRSGAPSHRTDIRFGRDIVRALAEAEASITAIGIR